ncbi:MAG: hypothetical protein VX111_05450 [Planctomycetota bacterium]|nr:hypothetical protein [Planctomycetota bacterium]
MICFRLLESDDPATPLAEAVATLRRGEDAESVYAVNPKSFRQVPNAPFAYWAASALIRAYVQHPQLEGSDKVAKRGVNTNDDWRFLRTHWEVAHQTWVNHFKGGALARFYSSPTVVLQWGKNELMAERVTTKKYKHAIIPSEDLYFRPGLTWSRRTPSALSVRLMPRNCIFGDKGPAFITSDDCEHDLIAFAAIFNSDIYANLIALQLAAADAAARSYEVGLLQKSPIPSVRRDIKRNLAPLAKSAWSLKRHLDTTNSNSHAFYAPALTPGQCTAPRLAAKPGGTR